MKIKYCKKYENYVSEQHCEFFNDGNSCEFNSPARWSSIKTLLTDKQRPKWNVSVVIKPFKCDLVSRENAQQRHQARGARKRLAMSS